MINCYLDESGNTGPILLSEANKNFDNQFSFALACICIDRDKISKFEYDVLELKNKHNIQLQELKCDKIYKTRDNFIFDLLHILKNYDVNILVELVDKKYALCYNVFNHLIIPWDELRYNYEDGSIANYATDLLYDNISDEFLIKFSKAAKELSKDSIECLFDCLLDELKSMQPRFECDKLSELVLQSKDRFLDESTRYVDAHTIFLPEPDQNKNGKNITMLPNLSSYTNMIARLNKIYKRNLSLINVIHDEQVHYELILKKYTGIMTSKDADISDTGNPDSDFEIKPDFTLIFKNSKDTIALQVADIIAGFSSRFYNEMLFIGNDNIAKDSKGLDHHQTAWNVFSGIQWNGIRNGWNGINIVSTQLIRNELYGLADAHRRINDAVRSGHFGSVQNKDMTVFTNIFW